MTRYVLCRPDAGLNDILCQIERCCRYAAMTDRTVVVDTGYRNAHYFNDSFARYFESMDRRLLLDPGNLVDSWRLARIYPEFLAGRLSEYKSSWSKERGGYCDGKTGQLIGFDMTKPYSHEVLIHHQAGGGQLSFFALARLKVRREITDELTRRLGAIGGPYEAIHVRHTDYRTDYGGVLSGLKSSLPASARLFLATDNRTVLQAFRDSLGAERVFSFSTLPEDAGRPVHWRAGAQARRANTDALIDLLMLGLAKRLRVLPIQHNGDESRYSGFSVLARNLWSSRVMLRHLLDRPELDTVV